MYVFQHKKKDFLKE